MLHHIRTTCVLAAFGALGLIAQPNIPAIPVVKTTAMIGLAEGQTAQLNLLNPGVLAPAVGVICTASVTFFDAAGTALKTAAVSVAPGKSGAVDLSGDTDLAIAAGERREIRAQFAIPGPVPATSAAAPPVTAACKLIPTLEIFDNMTGRTLVSLGHAEQVPAVVLPVANPN